MRTKIMSLLLCLALAGAYGCSEDDDAFSLPADLNGAWTLEAEGESGVDYFSADATSFTYSGVRYEATYYGYGFIGNGETKYGRFTINGQMHSRNHITFTHSVSAPGMNFSVYVTGRR